jgi:hypothetical protein
LALGSSSPWRPPELVTAHQKHPTGDEPRRTLEMINEVLEVMADLIKEGAR